MPISGGSFEPMFASQPFLRASGGDQTGTWAQSPPVPRGTPQTYTVRELLPFIPKALAAGHDLPPGQTFTVMLPENGSTDTKLSNLYQACPQLFAVEISPINDAPISLPAPGSWLGAAAADRAASLGFGSGPAFNGVSVPWQPPGPTTAGPAPFESAGNPFGSAEAFGSAEETDNPFGSAEMGNPFQSDIPAPPPGGLVSPSGPWGTPPQAESAPWASPASAPAPRQPAVTESQNWGSLFSPPAAPERSSRQEMLAQLPEPKSAHQGKTVELNVRSLLSGVPQAQLGVSTLHIPNGAMAVFSADMIRVQASLPNPSLTLEELAGACDPSVRAMLMPGNLQTRIPLPQNDLFHALAEDTGPDYLPPAAAPQSNVPSWMLDQEVTASPPWADPDVRPPTSTGTHGASEDLAPPNAPQTPPVATPAFETPFSSFARAESQAGTTGPSSLPTFAQSAPSAAPSDNQVPLPANFSFQPPASRAASPWESPTPSNALPATPPTTAATPQSLDEAFQQPWPTAPLPKPAEQAPLATASPVFTPAAQTEFRPTPAPAPEAMPETERDEPVWQGFLDPVLPQSTPAPLPTVASDPGASQDLDLGPALQEGSPFGESTAASPWAVPAAPEPASGGQMADPGAKNPAPAPIKSLWGPAAPSKGKAAAPVDPFGGIFNTKPEPAGADPTRPDGDQLDDLDDLPSFVRKPATVAQAAPTPAVAPVKPPVEAAPAPAPVMDGWGKPVAQPEAPSTPPVPSPAKAGPANPPAPEPLAATEASPLVREAIFSGSKPTVSAVASRRPSSPQSTVSPFADPAPAKAPTGIETLDTKRPASKEQPAPATRGSVDYDDLRDIELRAIFGTRERFTAQRIAELTSAMPGVLACVVSTPNQSASATHSGADQDLRSLETDRESLYQSMMNFARVMGMDDAETFTLHSGREVLSFFVNGNRFLTVRHLPGGFDPGIREKLILVARGLGGIDDTADV